MEDRLKAITRRHEVDVDDRDRASGPDDLRPYRDDPKPLIRSPEGLELHNRIPAGQAELPVRPCEPALYPQQRVRVSSVPFLEQDDVRPRRPDQIGEVAGPQVP